MKKVAIIGLSGSGKSVLARELGQASSIPVCHLDRYYWKPGWVEMDPEAFKEIHQALISQDQWILEGNSMITFDERVDAADTIIYLDMPRISCLWRVLKRRFFYANKDRLHRPCGCKEQISWKLIRYILWHFRTHYHSHVLEQLTKAKRKGKHVHIVHSIKSMRMLIKECAENTL